MMQHLAEQAGGPEMTLAAWADMDEDEPGELVDGHLAEAEDTGALHSAIASRKRTSMPPSASGSTGLSIRPCAAWRFSSWAPTGGM